ncbi:PIH1_CS domain-containing protein [Haematococcus lacustris]|uniref:PIH1_CS domain-containing protein n=1 Tax=Haematococcus lacustris TaxID=44745 RepID=A0A699Z1C7_HAELA|nr:PIH1_CS domain-containing protein [Haematococcus lacustris]
MLIAATAYSQVYEFMYKQAVGSADVYLGMSGKDESSGSCEDLVMKISLPAVHTMAGELKAKSSGPRLLYCIQLCEQHSMQFTPAACVSNPSSSCVDASIICIAATRTGEYNQAIGVLTTHGDGGTRQRQVGRHEEDAHGHTS